MIDFAIGIPVVAIMYVGSFAEQSVRFIER
jgi:hypothetical protein